MKHQSTWLVVILNRGWSRHNNNAILIQCALDDLRVDLRHTIDSTRPCTVHPTNQTHAHVTLGCSKINSTLNIKSNQVLRYERLMVSGQHTTAQGISTHEHSTYQHMRTAHHITSHHTTSRTDYSEVGHVDMFVAMLLDKGHAPNSVHIARESQTHLLKVPPIDLIDDLNMPRQNPLKQRHWPPVQCD